MKRRNKMLNPKPQGGVDRISHLPDDVLVHILSLLDTKDAVRSTALSREWRRRCVWVHVYNLSFHITSVNVASQILSVERTLDLHRAPKLARFSINMTCERQDQMLVRWLHFAVMRHVEVLNLSVPPFDELPEFLFSHDSLRELTTHGCDLSPSGRLGWASLRVLDVGLGDLVEIENLLPGCPSLESLTLRCVGFYGEHNIDITHEKLKKLVIEQPYGVHSNVRDPEVRVAAPQLEELHILGCWHFVTCKLVDVPSLVHVRLDFVFRKEGGERWENLEKELREKVRQKLPVHRSRNMYRSHDVVCQHLINH